MGARRRSENPAGRQDLERRDVDALVRFRRGLDVAAALGEARRVEHDQVVGGPGGCEFAEPVKGVGGLGRDLFGDAAEVGVVADAGEGVVARVEEVDGGGPGVCGVEAEATVGAEHVEHAAVAGEGAEREAVEPLVDEEASFRPAEHIDFERHAGLLDADGAGDRAAEDARRGLQPVLLPECCVVALDDRGRLDEGLERVEQPFAPLGHAIRERRERQHVPVAVHDRAGQAVALTEDEPGVGRARERGLPEGEGAFDARPEKPRVDLGLGVAR